MHISLFNPTYTGELFCNFLAMFKILDNVFCFYSSLFREFQFMFCFSNLLC